MPQTNLDAFVGPAAGVATSVLWTFTALFFSAAGQRIGPARVNALRILLAVVGHAVTYRALNEAWVPAADARQYVLLGLSGLIGLTLGDLALFTAFVRVGPRIAMLVMTTAPIFAALFGWVALGERLGVIGLLGMALTLGGVAWVVCERPAAEPAGIRASRRTGLVLALVAAICQAAGSLLSKAGIGHGLEGVTHLEPQAATLLRMFFAAVCVWPTLLWLGRRAPRDHAAPPPGAIHAGYLLTGCGAVVGPYLGVWMSLVAFDRTSLGIAQTLCSLPPVLVLPIMVWFYHEPVSRRAVLGALLAVAGLPLLFVAT